MLAFSGKNWFEMEVYITCRNFTDGGRVEAVMEVAVARLHEDGRVGEAVGKHLAVDVAKLNA